MFIETDVVNENGHRFLIGSPEYPVTPKFYKNFDNAPDLFCLTGASFSCHNCDQYANWQLVNEIPTIVGEPCKIPAEGLTTVIELAVPSGKLVVSDDLRPVYNWKMEDSKYASYNSVLGQAQAVQAMAEAGCAYGPTGNQGLGLYATGEPGKLVVLSPGYNEDTDEPLLPEGYVELASICTDLWAYSIADYEDWLSRGGKFGKYDTETVVDVEPGLYRFTYHGGEASFDRDAAEGAVFAHVEKIS